MNPEKLILIKNIATAIFLQILSTQLAFSQDAIYKCRLENGKIEIKDKPCTTNTRTERVLEKEYIPEERIEQAQRRRLEISAEKKEGRSINCMKP